MSNSGFSKMEGNYSAPKRRKKGGSPVAIAAVILILAIVAIIIVSLASMLVSAESNGDILELSVDWSAEQNGDSDYAKLVVNLYVNFNDMKVTSRNNNTLTVNGETVSFNSGSISGTSQKTIKKLLTSQEFEVLRRPGDTVEYPVEAIWNFNGKTVDGMVKTVTLRDTITLDNYSVTMSNPPASSNTPSTDDTTAEDTTASPDTVVTEPIIVPPAVTVPDATVLPENALNKTETFESKSGSKFIKTVAECTAVETGKTDRYGSRLANVRVTLSFEYYSLYMSKREGCVLQVGDKVISFEVEPINESIPAQHKQVIAELETQVKVGTNLRIYASIPLVSTSGSDSVNSIIIDEVMQIY